MSDTGEETRASIGWLGWARVIAMVGVICIHVVGSNAVIAREQPGLDATGLTATLIDFGFRWAAPLFVMASGVTLLSAKHYPGDREFYGRRASRLLPPLIFWHVVYALILYFFKNQPNPVSIMARILDGTLVAQLYFFWIILGLTLITPVLLPWVQQATLRQELAVGAGLTAAAILGTMISGQGSAAAEGGRWEQTAATYWIPYLGYFLLGHALSRIRLTHFRGVVATVLALLGTAVLVTQWLYPWPWRHAEELAPAESYFHPAVPLVTCAVFIAARWLISEDGWLAPLDRPKGADLGRRLGQASMGAFGVHLIVLDFARWVPPIGGDAASADVPQMLGRIAVVTVLSFAFALVAGKVPGLRRVV
ncbi:acyltransferase [Janibacter sp. G1551]|uniref:acyltransferase n=1 Tax=Janibacter sp. G1551 TaxID=3420440 RepID=UPI003D0708D6